jgi:hypothetical protein
MAFEQQERSGSSGFCRSVPQPQQVGVRLKLDPDGPWKPPQKAPPQSQHKAH